MSSSPAIPEMSSVPSSVSVDVTGVRSNDPLSGWKPTSSPASTSWLRAQSFGIETVNVEPPVTCTFLRSMSGRFEYRNINTFTCI